jgi:hypothetical protein
MSVPSTWQAASVDVNAAVAADVEPAVAAAAGLRLVGWAARESDGTAAVATFRLMNGATVSGGTLLVPVELAANESEGAWYGPEGIDSANGISIDHIAGTVDIVIYHKTLTSEIQ